MRKIAFIGGLAIAMAAGPAMAKTFNIVNTNETVAIEQVWFAHTGESDPWELVSLNEPVAPETTMPIEITGGSSCFYDIKVQFSDGTVQTFTNVNACKSDRVIAD